MCRVAKAESMICGRRAEHHDIKEVLYELSSPFLECSGPILRGKLAVTGGEAALIADVIISSHGGMARTAAHKARGYAGVHYGV